MRTRDLLLYLVCIIATLATIFYANQFRETEPIEPEPPIEYEVGEPKLAAPELVNRYRDAPTVVYVPEPTEPEPIRYELTNNERDLVERVVMAESGNQPYCGQMAVAQCLLNACEKDGLRPTDAVEVYQYTSNRVEPSESVRNAVAAVFDRGEVAVNETILWFYAPKGVSKTPWHETQRHVLTVNDHKFFAERGDADADH